MMDSATTKYNAIIVDADSDARMRLKQAASALPLFGAVLQTPNFEQACAKLELGEPCDVVFISSNFGREQVSDFIAKARGFKGGQDAAYVMTLKVKDQEVDKIATNMLNGGDGFLCEPFSVTNLKEITELAARVRMERSDARERTVIDLLVPEVGRQIDQFAFLHSCQISIHHGMKKLREKCSILGEMSERNRAYYFDTISTVFDRMPVRNFDGEKAYQGASQRLKKRMAAKASGEPVERTGPRTLHKR